MSKNLELLEAASDGNLEEVKELIVAGADVDARDNYGWTSLHIASRDGHLEVVKELIVAGADPSSFC